MRFAHVPRSFPVFIESYYTYKGKIMETELLKTGVFVMLIGMGTVFLFLLIMICMMHVNSAVLRYINKYCPEIPDTPQSNKKTAQNDLAEIAIAIACAINKQRRSKNDRQ